MEIKDIISSGLLELYITGLTSNEETKEVEEWAEQYPEVKNEIEELQNIMEMYAMAESIKPDDAIKQKILAKVQPDNSVKDKIFSRIQNSSHEPFSVIKTPQKTHSTPVYSLPSYYKWAVAASAILLLGSLILNYNYYSKYKTADNNAQVAQQQLQQQKKQTDVALNELQQEKQNRNLASEELLRQKQNKEAVTDKLQDARQTTGTIEEQLQHQKQVAEEMKRDLNVMTDKYSLPVVLKGTKNSPDALAKIFWMKNTGEVYVDPRNLPETPAGKQYQLWAIVDGNPIDAGMITTKKGVYHIQKMKSFGKAEAFAITLENSGGSATPTMDQMIVKAKI